ncbi:hypothetical protein XhyaCFBP1156_20610 [Xanthomonas hyacinthi]|uniref:Transposase DDE domain-containing protein n=1 Tax=Xanthomonas hyacinthi TaxID=56455 RepID=A0A2S7ENU5_9XANT|nr:hypothetical protein XhyaCFBP1156_20610 [Xanthomonas hyacinthi]
MKHDNAMDRCWLQGQTGDELHAVLCAASYNIRWLLRVIVRLRIKGFLRRCSGCWPGWQWPWRCYRQGGKLAWDGGPAVLGEFCRADYVCCTSAINMA